MKLKSRNCRGGALLVCVFIIGATLMIGMGSLITCSLASYRNACNRTQRNRMLYTAESGCQYALASLQSHANAFAEHPNTNDFCRIGSEFRIVYSNLFATDIELAYFRMRGGESYQTNALPDGLFKGMRATVKPIYVEVGVWYKGNDWKRPDSNVFVAVHQTIESRSISVAEYGVFVAGDIALNSDKGTTISGAIHCNGNLTLGMDGGQKLRLQNFVTCASNIYVSMGAGNIEINLPGDLTSHNMVATDGSVLDSLNFYWKSKALITWGGRVKSSVHGVPIFKIPIPYVSDNPRILIEPQTNSLENANISSARYYNRAAIRIIDDTVQVYSPSTSNFVDAARVGDGNNFLSTNAFFYNTSISNYVRPLDIDVGRMVAWAGGAFCNDSLRAGLVYVYSNSKRPVRIKNADTLPSSVVNGITNGFTFVTGNALYTWGHVNWPANPANSVPAACISDSMTVLSEEWTDAAHNDPSDGITKVNSEIHIWTSIVTGQTTNHLSGDTFFGGVEDLPKYIEDIVGTGVSAKKDIRGSIVSLWRSTSDLDNYLSATLDPANRLWTYDPKYAYSVGMPRFYEFVPKEWRRVAYQSRD